MISPLPLPREPRPKPERLPERRCVTVAAGFRFNGGVVLCADTQETTRHSKLSVPKIRVEPSRMAGHDDPDDLMVAITGAGNGPFIDKLVERCWEDVSVATSFDEACRGMENGVKALHSEYLNLFHVGYMPEADLVYGVKMQGKSKLFVAHGPIVNEKSTYAAVGAGDYMVDFLADRVHQRYLPGPQVVMLALYILFQCKEYVDGCGGDSHVAALNELGESRMLDPWRMDFANKQLRQIDDLFSELLLNAADFSTSDVDFEEQLNRVIDRLSNIRNEGGKFRTQWEDIMPGEPLAAKTRPSQRQRRNLLGKKRNVKRLNARMSSEQQ